MSLVATEKVLVIPTEEFHRLGHFQGFSPDVDRYFAPLLACGRLSYRPRGAMEEDPSYKQLIPYCIFRYRDAEGLVHLFDYQRGQGQGERRLHAKRSVGVGGHISTLDVSNEPEHDASYREGMRRELQEEVVVECQYEQQCVGLINDDETEVGRVHLGVVHLMDVPTPDVSPREEQMIDAGFRPVTTILEQLERYESWSQIAVSALFGRAGG